MSQLKLEILFKRCDTHGKGYIDHHEFRDLCGSFEISPNDADIIFADLDHDGDNRISFEDFSFGFRDFLTPGVRRGSAQLGLTRQPSFRMKKNGTMSGMYPGPESLVECPYESIVELEAKQKEMEEKHTQARTAWKHFAKNLGQEDVNKFLSSSGEKIASLYEELQSSEMPAHLLVQFEDVLSALILDVRKLNDEKKKVEERYARERETHNAHLKVMEAELDAQVARIEQQALEKAKQEHEHEKRDLQSKMDAELSELQTQLKLFQKVDSWLNKEKDENHSKETIRKLENAIHENRMLKVGFNETQTNIALLRAELNQMRSQYETKCSELSEERENKMEYIYEFDNLSRQLELLRDANQKLQDTNDGLRTVVTSTSRRSPGMSRRSEVLNLYSDARSSDLETRTRRRKSRYNTRSRSPSDQGGSYYDSDSLRSRGSRCSDRMKLADANYGIKRLMEDLDSGHSTLPGEDHVEDPMLSLEPEAADAIRELESAVEEAERGCIKSGHRKDEPKLTDEKFRDLTEIQVSDHSIARPPGPPVPAPRLSSFNRPVAEKSSNQTSSCYEATGPPDRTYKVVFAGDAAVGKTSFINRLTKGIFVKNLSSTLGVDFQVKTIHVDGRNIAIQLWDTAGQERFRSVTKSYFRRADGVMLLYDVTNERSFLSVRQWIEAVDEVAEKRIPIMLCGNKTDLRDAFNDNSCMSLKACVSLEDGARIARDHSAIFLETSSKSGDNVLEAVVELSREMCSSEDTEVQTSALRIRDENQNGKKGACCSSGKSKA